MDDIKVPETLTEALRYFTDPDVCLSFLAELPWPGGNVACPTCGSQRVMFLCILIGGIDIVDRLEKNCRN